MIIGMIEGATIEYLSSVKGTQFYQGHRRIILQPLALKINLSKILT